jgi:hypothetical protein
VDVVAQMWCHPFSLPAMAFTDQSFAVVSLVMLLPSAAAIQPVLTRIDSMMYDLQTMLGGSGLDVRQALTAATTEKAISVNSKMYSVSDASPVEQALMRQHQQLLGMVVDQAEELQVSQTCIQETMLLLSNTEEQLRNTTQQLHLLYRDHARVCQQAKEKSAQDDATVAALREQKADAEATAAAVRDALAETRPSAERQEAHKEKLSLKLQLGKVRLAHSMSEQAVDGGQNLAT